MSVKYKIADEETHKPLKVSLTCGDGTRVNIRVNNHIIARLDDDGVLCRMCQSDSDMAAMPGLRFDGRFISVSDEY